MRTLRTQGMDAPTASEWDHAHAVVTEWKNSGSSNRFRADDGNVVLALIGLTLADRMAIAPAGLADRREWVRDGGAAVTDDWDRLVPGSSRPDQRCQRRLMLVLAARTGRAIRLDWVRVDDDFWIVRTR